MGRVNCESGQAQCHVVPLVTYCHFLRFLQHFRCFTCMKAWRGINSSDATTISRSCSRARGTQDIFTWKPISLCCVFGQHHNCPIFSHLAFVQSHSFVFWHSSKWRDVLSGRWKSTSSCLRDDCLSPCLKRFVFQTLLLEHLQYVTWNIQPPSLQKTPSFLSSFMISSLPLSEIQIWVMGIPRGRAVIWHAFQRTAWSTKNVLHKISMLLEMASRISLKHTQVLPATLMAMLGM